MNGCLKLFFLLRTNAEISIMFVAHLLVVQWLDSPQDRPQQRSRCGCRTSLSPTFGGIYLFVNYVHQWRYWYDIGTLMTLLFILPKVSSDTPVLIRNLQVSYLTHRYTTSRGYLIFTFTNSLMTIIRCLSTHSCSQTERNIQALNLFQYKFIKLRINPILWGNKQQNG